MSQSYDIDIKVSADDSDLKAIANSLKDLEGSAEEAGNALQQAFQEATAEVERLEDALDEAYLNGDDIEADIISDELAEAQQAADELADALQNVGNATGMQESSDAARDLGDNSSNADSSVQDLAASMDLINATALLGAAQEISALGAKAEDMSQQMNTAAISVGQLATQTGIAEPQMVSLINNISNATFPNEEAMMYVKSLDQIGISSENLGKSATDLDKINDAFGLGAETVNSLGQELSVLGVDMNNVSSSFNALAYANANTVGGMDNYYNFLRKYDAEFKELGFNVDQASVIIAAATQKFGGGRAALSGLSTALKESNGDTRKLEEALGLTAGSISNASQLTGEYEGQLQKLADEEAEHKTLLDQIGAAWEDFSLTLSPILEPLGAIAGVFGTLGSMGMTIMGLSSLAEVFGLTATMAEGGVLAITAFGGTLSFSLGPIAAIVAAIVGLGIAFEQFGEYMGWWDSFGGMLEAAKAAVMRFWEAFINHPDVQAILEALGDAWEWLVDVTRPLVDWLKGIWNEIFPPSASGQVDAVGIALQVLGTIWEVMTAPIKAVVTGLKAFFEIIGMIGNAGSDAFTSIYETLSSVWEVIQYIGAQVLNFFLPVINGLQVITAVIQGMFTGQIGILDGIMIIGQTITNMYVGFWQNLSNLFMQGFMSIVNTVSTGVMSVWNSFLSFLGRIAQLPAMIGGYLMRIVTAVIAWGTQMVSRAQTAATNFVNSVINGIASLPSKFRQSIDRVLTELTNWGKNMVDKAAQIMRDVANYIGQVTGLTSGFSGNFSAGFDSGNTLNNALSNQVSNNNKSNITNNFSINGIIEEEAADFIVSKVNEHVRRQNLIRGV